MALAYDVRLGGEDVLRLAVAELARRVRLREVVDARRAAADRLLGRLGTLEAGDRVQQLARLDADPLRVREVARVLEGDAQLERMPLRSRLLRQQLGDVDDAHVEPRVLEMRPAAGGVDGDRSRPAARTARPTACAMPLPLLPPSCMEMERAAAGLTRGGVTTSKPSAASTRAVATLTSPKTALCTQPVSRPIAAALTLARGA